MRHLVRVWDELNIFDISLLTVWITDSLLAETNKHKFKGDTVRIMVKLTLLYSTHPLKR